MTKSVVAVVPDSRDVALDRQVVDASPANLSSAVEVLMKDMTTAIGNMKQVDDLTFEFDGHSSPERSSARIRVRAYRRSNGST
jgi:hypothetical protein